MGALVALAGALLATWLWMLCNDRQVERLRQWLMAGELAAFPALKGVWSMVATYVRRAVRTREQAAAAAEQRVQDILAAPAGQPERAGADGRRRPHRVVQPHGRAPFRL